MHISKKINQSMHRLIICRFYALQSLYQHHQHFLVKIHNRKYEVLPYKVTIFPYMVVKLFQFKYVVNLLENYRKLLQFLMRSSIDYLYHQSLTIMASVEEHSLLLETQIVYPFAAHTCDTKTIDIDLELQD